jgi:hypothetical protein
MAAIGASATMLKSGDHVVVSDNTYGGTFRLFDKVLRRYQLSFTYVDTSDLDQVERAMTPATKMLFVETPTNPVMRLTDLRAAADLAHRHDARLVVDNTFASPCPAADRARRDLVDAQHHSTSTATATASAASSSRCDDEDIEWLRSCRTLRVRSSSLRLVLVPGADKTPPWIRMQAHNANGPRLPSSERTRGSRPLPGLPSHPADPAAKKQMARHWRRWLPESVA